MRRSRSGHALLVALIVLVLVGSVVTLVVTHYSFRARLMSQEARRIHLGALVDAVAAETLASLAESSGFRGVAERPFGGGTMASDVHALVGNRREILARAQFRGWTREVRLEVIVTGTHLSVVSWSVLSANRQTPY